MRNILINVFQEKSGNERWDEEDKRDKRDIIDVKIGLRLHEFVEPDGNVNYANDEEQTWKRVQQRDLVELGILQNFQDFNIRRFVRRLDSTCRQLSLTLFAVFAVRQRDLEENRRQNASHRQKQCNVL